MSWPGCYVALATPFNERLEVDFEAFKRLLHQVAPEVDGLLVLGSTGEAATVLDHERKALIEMTLAYCRGKKVVVGTGSNATTQAVAWTQMAAKMGADAGLVVTPYYNKPTPDGIVAHFQAIAQANRDFPLWAYNVPGRTGINLDPDTVSRLWQIPEVEVLKESSGNLLQIAEIARALPNGKTLLSGDDIHALASITLGANGLVSVMGNLIPSQTQKLVDLCLSGQVVRALELHRACKPLMDALFAESNPIPLKAGLKIQGLADEFVRLPLVPAQPKTIEDTQKALNRVPLLEAIQGGTT